MSRLCTRVSPTWSLKISDFTQQRGSIVRDLEVFQKFPYGFRTRFIGEVFRATRILLLIYIVSR